MSYIVYQMKCNKCEEIWDTAFGVSGDTYIAEPTTQCPYCGSPNIEKCESNGWN